MSSQMGCVVTNVTVHTWRQKNHGINTSLSLSAKGSSPHIYLFPYRSWRHLPSGVWRVQQQLLLCQRRLTSRSWWCCVLLHRSRWKCSLSIDIGKYWSKIAFPLIGIYCVIWLKQIVRGNAIPSKQILKTNVTWIDWGRGHVHWPVGYGSGSQWESRILDRPLQKCQR